MHDFAGTVDCNDVTNYASWSCIAAIGCPMYSGPAGANCVACSTLNTQFFSADGACFGQMPASHFVPTICPQCQVGITASCNLFIIGILIGPTFSSLSTTCLTAIGCGPTVTVADRCVACSSIQTVTSDNCNIQDIVTIKRSYCNALKTCPSGKADCYSLVGNGMSSACLTAIGCSIVIDVTTPVVCPPCDRILASIFICTAADEALVKSFCP